MATPQNGQAHSNNSSAIANELFVFDHFVGLGLKGLKWEYGDSISITFPVSSHLTAGISRSTALDTIKYKSRM